MAATAMNGKLMNPCLRRTTTVSALYPREFHPSGRISTQAPKSPHPENRTYRPTEKSHLTHSLHSNDQKTPRANNANNQSMTDAIVQSQFVTETTPQISIIITADAISLRRFWAFGHPTADHRDRSSFMRGSFELRSRHIQTWARARFV